MSWGTTINTILVPGITFADAAKINEFTEAVDTLRTEALIHAASNPPPAKQLNAEFADWSNRFQIAVRKQADVCLVKWELDERKFRTDKRRWPKETPDGVIIHDIYFSWKSHDDILDWDSQTAEEASWSKDQMLALWAREFVPKTKRRAASELKVWTETLTQTFRDICEFWEERVFEAEKFRLGKAALEKRPNGFREG